MVFHICTNNFNSLNDKVIEGMIGIGLSSIVQVYSYIDGVKFLSSNIDKIIYLFSCMLQKPILLPIIFKDRFKSREASIEFSEQTIIRYNGRMPSLFVLTVQETNFLYSFTLTGFIALCIVCEELIDKHFDEFTLVTIYLGVITWVYGLFACFYLYGRKVRILNDDEISDIKSESEGSYNETSFDNDDIRE